MLHMSNSRRSRYYDYLRATNTADTTDEVNKSLEKRPLVPKSNELELIYELMCFWLQLKSLIRSEVYADKLRLGLTEQRSEHIEYGLGKSTMLLKITDQTMRKWKNHRYACRTTPLELYND